jgi:hypothetical protein
MTMKSKQHLLEIVANSARFDPLAERLGHMAQRFRFPRRFVVASKAFSLVRALRRAVQDDFFDFAGFAFLPFATRSDFAAGAGGSRAESSAIFCAISQYRSAWPDGRPSFSHR